MGTIPSGRLHIRLPTRAAISTQEEIEMARDGSTRDNGITINGLGSEVKIADDSNIAAPEITIAVTFFENYNAFTNKERKLSVDELLELFTHTTAEVKGRLPWVKFARFGAKKSEVGSLRTDKNVLDVTAGMGDYDGEQISFETAVERVRSAGIAAFLYTSPSHTAAKPRWRVIAIFSGELSPALHRGMMDRLNGAMGGVLAAESWTLSQAYYYGYVVGVAGHRVIFIPGDPINQRPDLPAIGKPRGSNGEALADGAFDETVAIEDIVTGASCHTPTVRLAGYWAHRRIPMDEAIERLCAVFDRAEVKNERWQKRRDDVERCVRDIYAKEAVKPENKLPVIRVVAGARHEAADAGIRALVAADVPIYRRDKRLVYVTRFPAKDSNGNTILTPGILTVPSVLLMRELGRAARWEKADGRMKASWKRIDPPGDVAAQIESMVNEWPFAPLVGIIGTQTLRPDGSLLTTPGYDAVTGYYLFEPPPMPPIPKAPSRNDALAALLVLNSLLDEFPFADEASRSVALSMMMTPVARPALALAVPMHVTRAPDGGTGKSYLGDVASGIATGERCPVIVLAERNDESEKRLIGTALTGQPIISIDNRNGELRAEFLCQAIERPRIQLRPLGGSEMPIIPNSFTCFANGNNIEIADDLVRRTIQCSLDANVERPEEREFKKKPFDTIIADRGRYVAAVLTIITAYIQAKQQAPRPFLSFDAWSNLIRGSLIWLGCTDPVLTVAAIAATDPVRETVTRVFSAVAAAGGLGQPLTVGELVAMSFGHDELRAVLSQLAVAGDRDGQISPDRLGWWCRRHVNKVAAGIKLIRSDSTRGGSVVWCFADKWGLGV
jgi:hypothetical protein